MFLALKKDNPSFPASFELVAGGADSTLIIGRMKETADVVLQYDKISRKHVKVCWKGGGNITECTIQVLGVNGVYINDEKYAQGAEAKLLNGDVIALIKETEDDVSFSYRFNQKIEISEPIDLTTPAKRLRSSSKKSPAKLLRSSSKKSPAKLLRSSSKK
eukprot:Platyproteum_vivax@DN2996_c0_g1_i1.p1